jgi:predicted transcriptional regulator
MQSATEALKRPVRAVMETNVFWIAADMPLDSAAKALAERQFSGAPVTARDGRIIGMISKTDLTEFYGPSHELRVARDVMTPELLAVSPDEPLQRAVQLMAFEGVHRLLVLDEQDRLLGIVTSMDVLRELAGYPRQTARVQAVAPPR